MVQIADALVTGFAKSPLLIEQSLAPLRLLRREGHFRTIHYVTWDGSDLDGFVAPLLAMDDVHVTRVQQPNVQGVTAQKNLAFQIANLEAGLGLIAEDTTIVFKSRPDLVADVDFLREKVIGFETDCEIDPVSSVYGIRMPKPTLSSKIWVPWADCNQPFFYEDAAFMGRKRDLMRLVTPLTAEDLAMAAEPSCSHYVHIVRFAKIFLETQPLFRGYLQNFTYLTSDMDYRCRLIPHVSNEAFFWMLILAHAWVLHSEFHVDCGEPGDILFYPSYANSNTDWADPMQWRNTAPYGGIDGWRHGTGAGSMMMGVSRPFGRLMDEDWQRAVFTQELPDFPRETLIDLLEHVATARDGHLRAFETQFYESLKQFHYQNAHHIGTGATLAAVEAKLARQVGAAA